MQHNTTKSIRAFIGAINFEESRQFYLALGFEEAKLSPALSYFKISATLGFYLQNAYVKDWVDNTMLFVEVENVEDYYNALQQLELDKKFKNVRLVSIKENDWGKECFLHDPSGILWHFGQFN
jgi:catechol 2,3-dioxygenase-like lactoylglutathione lyase family enzyme